MILCVELLAAQIVVSDTTVEEQTRLLAQHTGSIKADSGHTALHDIVVCRVEQSVFPERILFDTIVGNCLLDIQVTHDYRCVDVEHQSDVMGLFYVKVRITV